MGTVIREITIGAPADIAWSAVSDVGSVPKRLVPGFVRDTPIMTATIQAQATYFESSRVRVSV